MWVIMLITVMLWACGSKKQNKAEKQAFYYNQSGGIGSLDPAFAGNQANIWAVNQLFNGLVSLDKQLNVVPELAKSWNVDSAGKIYTFYLHSNVEFHTNKLFENEQDRKMSAYDVEYSLRRVIDSTSLFNKGMWIFKDKVLKNSSGTLSDTCFLAVNDTTFRIYLNEPFPFFLEILTMPYAYVVPKKIAEHYGLDFRSHPVGTGPFRFQSWDEGNSLILRKNPNYWKKDAEGHILPYLDAIKVSFISDKTQAYRMFLMKQLDFFSGIEEGVVDEVLYANGTVKESMREKCQVDRSPYLNTEYLCFQLDPNAPCYKNSVNHPFLNKDFRKALSFSIDRNRMVFFLKNGLGQAAIHGMVPTAISAYDNSRIIGYSKNPDSALFYLNRAKVQLKEFKNLSLTVSKEHKALSEFLVKEWRDNLKVDFNIDLVDSKVYRSMAEKGEVPFFRASWLGDYPDPENYLALFYSGNFTPNGPNKSHYKNATFDKLYETSKTILNRKERYQLYYEMDQLLMNDAPVIPLYYDEILRLNQFSITGLEMNAMNSLKLEQVHK